MPCVKQGHRRDGADFVFILWAGGVCVGGGLDDLLLAGGGGDGGEKSNCCACVCNEGEGEDECVMVI